MTEKPRLSFTSRINGVPPSELHYGSDPEVRCPISDKSYTVLTEGASVRDALTSPRVLFSTSTDHTLTGAEVQRPDGLLRLNGEELRKYRKIINPYFSARATEEGRSQSENIAVSVVTQIDPERNPVIDFNAAIVDPIVSRAVTGTMGLSIEDWPFLRDSSNASLAIMDDHDVRQESMGAWVDLYGYFAEKAEEKRTKPDEGIVSRLVADLDDAGFTTDQTVSTLASVSNGFPAVQPVFNVAMVELLQRPDIVKACLEEPTYWKDVVEEVLRYKAHFSVLLPRVVTEDMQLGESTVEEGTVILPSIYAATRDPELFSEPDRLSPDQAGPKNIVFGAGKHFCPGAAMTKQWMEEGFKAFFEAFPNASLAIPPEDLEWQDGSLSVPKQIPVALNN